MKKIGLVLIGFLGACTSPSLHNVVVKYQVDTQRQKPYYLATNPEQVEDTCPGNDILKQYNCTEQDADGQECFDVYMVQGSPTPQERYTLLKETIEQQNVTAEPACPAQVSDCKSFLKALDYNLEFSWYVANFPSSSFEQCRETYDCKRVDCYRPDGSSNQPGATLISCVYKKNQLFFVGSEIT